MHRSMDNKSDKPNNAIEWISVWVKFISKDSNTLEIEHSLLNSPIIIFRYMFLFRSTDLADKPYL